MRMRLGTHGKVSIALREKKKMGLRIKTEMKMEPSSEGVT